jgi:hypothetical protein
MKSQLRITTVLIAFSLPALAQVLQPKAGAERHDYTRGDALGAIGAKRQKLEARSSAPRPSAPAGQYNFMQVDVPGSVLTALTGINSSGQTVGVYVDRSGTVHGLLRNINGSFVTIDYPGAIFTGANGINSQGDIVGRWDDSSTITHPFLRTSQGTITSFDPPAPCVPTTEDNEILTTAHGINDLGDIVGRCADASGKELGWLLRHDGSFTILDNPSFSSTDSWKSDNTVKIVGDYSDADGNVHGYTWTETGGFTPLDFENQPDTAVRGINQRGDIGGIYFDNGFILHGFLRLENGTDFTIDPPGSTFTGSTVVNNSRILAGDYNDADGNDHGYIAIPAAAGQD